MFENKDLLGKMVKIDTGDLTFDARITDVVGEFDTFGVELDNGRFYIMLRQRDAEALAKGIGIGVKKSYDYSKLERYKDADGEYDLTKLSPDEAKELLSNVSYYPLHTIRQVKRGK